MSGAMTIIETSLEMETALGKFREGLSKPGKIPTTNHVAVDLIRRTRPELADVKVFSDEDLRNFEEVESVEYGLIKNRMGHLVQRLLVRPAPDPEWEAGISLYENLKWLAQIEGIAQLLNGPQPNMELGGSCGYANAYQEFVDGLRKPRKSASENVILVGLLRRVRIECFGIPVISDQDLLNWSVMEHCMSKMVVQRLTDSGFIAKPMPPQAVELPTVDPADVMRDIFAGAMKGQP